MWTTESTTSSPRGSSIGENFLVYNGGQPCSVSNFVGSYRQTNISCAEINFSIFTTTISHSKGRLMSSRLWNLLVPDEGS